MDPALTGRDYRSLSLWFDQLVEQGVDELVARPPLQRDRRVDVCIVGGGLTGLWTAYYLAKADPGLSIAVIEKHIAGFGASGRNGGWCSALFPRDTASLERQHGRGAALAMRRAMVHTVAEVGRVVDAEGIDCDFEQGGTLAFARDAVQRRAARTEVEEARGYGVDALQLLDAEESGGFGVTTLDSGPLEAVLDPACARLQPAKLVRGLARVVEGLGVEIFEDSTVVNWAPHRVSVQPTGSAGSDHQTLSVSAESVVIAVEGFGADLARVGRHVLPLYSLMIATEPLPADVWERIGINQGQTFTDYRHLLIYAQRTADDRIAFGGRGARYHWGSSIRPEYDRAERVFGHLQRALTDLLPDTRGARITHRWGGPLGVARDWHATASYNPRTGVGTAGGYVGDGLATTNLAGRTLADLIRGERTALTDLPWVNHRSPRWEPEPLRFVGANLGLLGMGLADVEERVTGRASMTARVLGPLTGH